MGFRKMTHLLRLCLLNLQLERIAAVGAANMRLWERVPVQRKQCITAASKL